MTSLVAQFGISSHGKSRSRDLNQQPGDDCVGDRHLVDVAPLQLGEEVALAHCFDKAAAGLSPVNVLAVPHALNLDYVRIAPQFINDTIVADADSIGFSEPESFCEPCGNGSSASLATLSMTRDTSTAGMARKSFLVDARQ